MATNLKAVLQRKKEIAERQDRPKVEWFGLKEGGSAKVVFLQELDEELADAKGSALFLVEHTSPQDFKRRAECTFDEDSGGRCFACEMNQEQPGKNWWSKTNFYVNVYVEEKGDKPGEGSIKVLSRSIPNKEGGFFDQLVEWAVDENEGKVTGKTFTISKGSEKTSAWTFIPSNKVIEVPEEAELVDLANAVARQIPYEEQKKFYLPKGDDFEDGDDSGEKPIVNKPTPKNENLDW